MDKHVPKSIILLTRSKYRTFPFPMHHYFSGKLEKLCFSLEKLCLQSFPRGNFQHLTNIPNDENLN